MSTEELSDEREENMKKKYIDFNEIKFPEINPIDFKLNDKGNEVKIANYRYPNQAQERKGIIIFLHGYGDYCGRYAYLAKAFAENGYDFVGIDQKGFGHSEGSRGMFDSEE